MKNVIIFGAGNFGKKLISRLESNSSISIIGIADNANIVSGKKYAIVDLEDKKYINVDVIIAIARPQSVIDVYNQLIGLGYKKIFWYNPNMGTPREEFGKVPLIECQNWGDCVLPQVEMHVIDGCNLNCRGCTHFSPIFTREIPDIERRLNDIRKLKSLFSHIAVFYILGGEPLLNPQLKKYICEIRNILPETNIVLVTNGLLIPSIDEKILKCIQENKVMVSISEYEPTHKIINKIIARLEEFEIKYQLRAYDNKQKFNKPLSLCQDSIHKHKCISDGCINLYEGKIARCPTLMYIDHFNEVFQTSLPNEGIIELETVHNGRELLEKLKQSVPLCRHCIESEMPWSSCGKEIDVHDFAVED